MIYHLLNHLNMFGRMYLPEVKRILLMLAGILLIGMCVAFYRMSGFGVDAFSCMNLGVSGFLKMSFGNWQLIVNAVLLIVVWFAVRHCIGPGTVVNMVGVGYTADFLPACKSDGRSGRCIGRRYLLCHGAE